MKKTLLTITAVTAFIGAFAQQSTGKINKKALGAFEKGNFADEITVTNSSNASSSNSNQKVNSSSIQDTVSYFANKVFFLTPSNSFGTTSYPMPSPYANDPTAPEILTHFGVTYVNSSTITVSGLAARAARKATSTSPTVTITILLCNATASNTPILPAIDSVNAVLTGTANTTVYGNLSSPKTVTGNFSVIYKIAQTQPTTDSIKGVMYYSRSVSGMPTAFNFDEGLSFMRDGGTFYKSDFGTTYGAYEFRAYPIINTTLSSYYSSVNTGSCSPSTYTNTNLSTSLYTNKMFNFNSFMSTYTPTVAVSGSTVMPTYSPVFVWDANNGSALVNTANSTATYTTGAYTPSLTANFRRSWTANGTYKNYADSYNTNITINTCTGINELTSTELVVYPNPTNGLVNIKNLSYNSTIELYNVLGDLIYKEKNSSESVSLDLTKYTSGNYFLKVISNEGASTMKKLILN